jgi:hypothetical protein
MPYKPTGKPNGRPPKSAATGMQTTGKIGTSFASGVLPGWGDTEPNITIYRRMRKDPTLAIARIASQAPVKRLMSRATFLGDPAKAQFIADTLSPDLRRALVRDCAGFGVDYGYQAHEIVWGIAPLDGKRWVPIDFKPLLPEITQPVLDDYTGVIRCVKNKGYKGPEVILEQGDFFWFSHASEARSPFGSPRMENCRVAWNAWEKWFFKLGQYVNKVAGVTPMVEYPTGTGRDELGRVVDNFDVANAMLARLGSGHGVAMPNTLAAWAAELAQKGVDVGKIPAWNIKFLEASAHGQDLLGIGEKLDVYKLRAYITPERSLIEAKHGSKADSGSAVDILTEMASDVAHEIVDAVNKQIIPEILAKNFGEEYRDAVKMQIPAGEGDESNAMRTALDKLLATQPGVDALLQAIDLDASADMAGLPRKSGESLNTRATDAVDYHRKQAEKTAQKTAAAGGSVKPPAQAKPPQSGTQNPNSSRQAGGK